MKPRLTIVCAAVLLTSCAPRYDIAECSKSWNEMETPAGQEEWAMDVILHYDWPKGSTGEYVRRCLEAGWRPEITPMDAPSA